jgi:hypothetical protein
MEGQEMLKAAAVTKLLTEHRSGKADNRKKLWTLIALKMWQKQLVR